MVFTSTFFLFYFLPFVWIAYFSGYMLERLVKSNWISKLRIKDVILFLLSLGFYMWAGVDDGFRLIVYIFVIWLLARSIQEYRKKSMFEEGNSLLQTIKMHRILFFECFFRFILLNSI